MVMQSCKERETTIKMLGIDELNKVSEGPKQKHMLEQSLIEFHHKKGLSYP